MPKYTLISSPTCPYVQRAVIALTEKNAAFEVTYVDLQNKPDWFLALSPLGKVPVLKVERDGEEPVVLFESAVICEYLEEVVPGTKLHPADPLEKARHRAWMEFGSSILMDNWKLWSAKDATELAAARKTVFAKFERLETVIAGTPYFAGAQFSIVDAVFGPVFRQIDAIESAQPLGILAGLPKVDTWRKALAARPSVISAVPADFREQFLGRLRKQDALILKPEALAAAA